MDFGILSQDLAGSVTVGAMVIIVMQWQFAAMKKEAKADKDRADSLAQKVDALESQIKGDYARRMNKLEMDVNTVNLRCRGEINHEALDEIRGLIVQVGQKVDKIDREVGEVKSELRAKDGWISKIDDTLGGHVQNMAIHQKG